LGVNRDATELQIKNAFRKKAIQFHPARHLGESKQIAEGRFTTLAEAYEVLSNGMYFFIFYV